MNYTREEPQRIRIGDILENRYASETNPLRKSIIIQSGAKVTSCAYVSNGRIKTAGFRTRDIQYDERFVITNHIDIIKMLDIAING